MTNKLILGTVQFGLNYGINNTSGKPDKERVYAILDEAFKNGIRLLDSAEAYGDAHEVIGLYHALSQNKFDLITKYSSSRRDLPENLITRVKFDIQTLNCSSLYAYMFHSFSDFKNYFQIFKADIAQLKKEGLIQKMGVSVYTNNELEELLNFEEVELVQLPFNLLDNNYQRAALIRKAKIKGMEVHTRSAFLQGLFFKKQEELPLKLQKLISYLNVLNSIAGKNQIAITDLALNYALQQPNIDHVLIGVDTLEQLKNNLSSLGKFIPASVLAQVDELKVHEVELLNPSNWNE